MRSLILAALLWIAAVPALAQLDVAAINTGIDDRRGRLTELAAEVSDPGSRLVAIGSEVREIRAEAYEQTAPLRRIVRELRADLGRLGPAPEEGAPPESAAIAAERARLNQRIADLDGAIRQSDLNIAEAERILEDIREQRRERFFSDLFERTRTPFNPRVWSDAATTFAAGADRLAAEVGVWQAEKEQTGEWQMTVLLIVGSIVLAFGLFIPIRHISDRVIIHRLEGITPLPSRRVLVAAIRAGVRGVPAIIGGFVIYEVLQRSGAITADGAQLARIIWFSFVALFITESAATAVFAPKLPTWRVLPLEGPQVIRIRLLLISAVALLGLTAIALAGADFLETSPALVGAVKSASVLLLAPLVWALTRRSLWTLPSEQAEPGRRRAVSGRLPVVSRTLVILAVAAVLCGYVAFGHYIMTRMFYLAGLFTLVLLVRALLREGMRIFDRKFSSARQEGDEGESLLYYWLSLTIDFISLMALVPFALIILGAEWSEVGGWVGDAFFGFNIGSIRISMVNIFGALALFLGLLYVTRLVQHTAEKRFFPGSRMDIGVQNSLKTLIGYVGLVIAAAIGINTLGFDLSNLAIIAGALSVGIGFGLQSIVNNFVSGLILLFERPIKVNDWIVTASGEGIVKRISVRSTEIETFDRSSIIIPNSELISSSVTNWTHKNKIGRVTIPIGVSYDADPQQVLDLLKEVAEEHEQVLDNPNPLILFTDYGDSSLNFELRVYLRDIGSSLSVRTQLRVALFAKLKQAGIEIPFPQRDLHIIPPKNGPEPELAPVDDLPELPAAATPEGSVGDRET